MAFQVNELIDRGFPKEGEVRNSEQYSPCGGGVRGICNHEQ